MKRYIDDRVKADLKKKLVILTGSRQVGKTTLSQQLVSAKAGSVYLNYDVAEDRSVILGQSWSSVAPLVVLDEIHKMPDWKRWLKGVFDGRPTIKDQAQQYLITGSARMETFRMGGESLAGRYYAIRLHPLSVRELCDYGGFQPHDAILHLLNRGGFPEPCLATSDDEASRWRMTYLDDMLREDVLEFSRIRELNAMRLFVQTLRQRVGSPLSLASIARDMGVSSKTLATYLDILEALFIVFVVRPFGKNIARATLQQPKVYFFDTGLVQGDDGVRFENLVAAHLLKHTHWQRDSAGKAVGLHYIRTKDNAEVDFALADSSIETNPQITHLIECKLSDTGLHPALMRFAKSFPEAQAVQLLRDLRNPLARSGVQILAASQWLMGLSA